MMRSDNFTPFSRGTGITVSMPEISSMGGVANSKIAGIFDVASKIRSIDYGKM